jgi:hypothetical protein
MNQTVNHHPLSTIQHPAGRSSVQVDTSTAGLYNDDSLLRKAKSLQMNTFGVPSAPTSAVDAGSDQETPRTRPVRVRRSRNG